MYIVLKIFNIQLRPKQVLHRIINELNKKKKKDKCCIVSLAITRQLFPSRNVVINPDIEIVSLDTYPWAAIRENVV
jgi:hypothetical protein